MNTSITNSAATPPKVGLFGNTFCNNLQSANEHMLVPSLSPKSVFGDDIISGKGDSSAPCMIPKPVFVEEVDDNDDNTDFEPVSCVRIVSAWDNQTYQSVIGRNIAGPPGEQRLLGAESSKQKQLDEWLHCRRYGGLNVLWC